MVELIWATRGRTWGFRFLLDGGVPNPLALYESAFVGAEHETALFRRSDSRVTLRLPDPLGRTDSARRLIPHDFVIMGPRATTIGSIDDGFREIWPIVTSPIWMKTPPDFFVSEIRTMPDSVWITPISPT